MHVPRASSTFIGASHNTETDTGTRRGSGQTTEPPRKATSGAEKNWILPSPGLNGNHERNKQTNKQNKRRGRREKKKRKKKGKKGEEEGEEEKKKKREKKRKSEKIIKK